MTNLKKEKKRSISQFPSLSNYFQTYFLELTNQPFKFVSLFSLTLFFFFFSNEATCSIPPRINEPRHRRRTQILTVPFYRLGYLREFPQILSRWFRWGEESEALECRRGACREGKGTINCSRSPCSRGDADRTPAVLA